jgi:hypothetical protein
MSAVVDNRASATSIVQHWNQWQSEVVAVLQRDFRHLLHEISHDDVDWPSWHRFFVEGRSPRAAVMRALERDL